MSAVNFPLWVRHTWRLTVASVVISSLGAVLLATVLAYFARTSSRGDSEARNPLFGNLPASPTSGTSLLLVMGLLFVVSSAVMSGTHRIESLILRKHLRLFSQRLQDNAANLGGVFVRERVLARSWINMLSAGVQPAVLGILLLLLFRNAWPLWLAFAICTLLILRAHWRGARQASLKFIAVRRRIRASSLMDSPSELESSCQFEPRSELQIAYYERDAKALRLPPGLSLLLTLSIIVTFGGPVALDIDTPQVGIGLIVLFLLHQRLIDFLMSVGRFSWALTFWQSPADLRLGGEDDG